jgi:hypothetical protein
MCLFPRQDVFKVVLKLTKTLSGVQGQHDEWTFRLQDRSSVIALSSVSRGKGDAFRKCSTRPNSSLRRCDNLFSSWRASIVKPWKIDDDFQRHDGSEGNTRHRDQEGRNTESPDRRQAHARSTGSDPVSASR